MLTPRSNIKRSSLRDQALAAIREGLISGQLEPGGIYSAPGLAAELGVSATPVRDAMLTLVHQGLIEAVRNRGFRVVTLSAADRLDIVQLRVLLEIPAMEELTGSPQVKDHYAEFSAVAADIVTAARHGDLIGYLDADRHFHLGLLDLLGNRRLVTVVGDLRGQTSLYGLRKLCARGGLTASAEEHLPILDALMGGDSHVTTQLMHKHLEHLTSD
ncbi:FCD domain-containing protein [Nocardia sp. SYP-A9097]|uniref:GntR family transcriptional regulator n=1 Tax=Nocardia sp. SYP-A9097 TaxID=2663237 RepID=UPI00129B052E|nr:GntR family transcriptional regulator [Nocardia sp. SYP-A9097]MRH91212.1 FCD domain-containing protein [Nocardia sp. SYP-A9097]